MFYYLELIFISHRLGLILIFIYMSFIFHYLLFSVLAPVYLLKVFVIVLPLWSIFNYVDSLFSLNVVGCLLPSVFAFYHMIVYYDINFIFNSEFAILFDDLKESLNFYSELDLGEKLLNSSVFNVNFSGHIKKK